MDHPGLFGQLVKHRRFALHLTMAQLAQKCKTTKGYVSGVENGHVSPFGPKKIPRVALVLGVDIEVMAMLAWADKAPKHIRREVQTMTSTWIRKNHGKIDGLNGGR
jgi:transcriptional regulator with XRE-family HTH domain